MSLGRVDSQRKFYLRQFHDRSRLVLSELERQYLHDVLREYHNFKDVASLVIALMNCLDTPRKLDLLREIRNIIPPADVMEFDRLAPYHRMAHPYEQHSSFRSVPQKGHYTTSQTRPQSPSQPRQSRSTTPTPSPRGGVTTPTPSPRGGVMTVHRLAPQKVEDHKKLAYHESHSSAQDYLSATFPAANDTKDKSKPKKKTRFTNDIIESSKGSNSANHNGYTQEGTLHVITINKDDDNLGFSIRGGSEHGLGIFVSQIDEDSVADRSELEVGDQILEVNSVTFDNVATSSAVMVLQGSSRLRMIVRHTGKVPGFKVAKEKTSWYDTLKRTIVKDRKVDENDPPNTNRSEMHILSGTDERRVTLHVGENQMLGLNIRGGAEYGLGIYVSRVDRGGPAEASGIRVGDLLLDVNGKNFQNISHGEAVDFLRRQKHLILTIKDVNKYPAYKEMIAEYSWSDGEHQRIRVLRSNTAPPTVNHSWQSTNGPSDAIPTDMVNSYSQILAQDAAITSTVAETTLQAAPRRVESQSYTIDSNLEIPPEKSQSKKSSIGILTVLKGNKSQMSRSQSLNIKYNPEDLEAKQFYNDEKKGKKVKRSRSIKDILFRGRSKDKTEKSKTGSQGTSSTKPKTRLGLGSFLTSKQSSKSPPPEEAVSRETETITQQIVDTTHSMPPSSNGVSMAHQVQHVPRIVVREPSGEARLVEEETRRVRQEKSAFQDTYGSIGKKRGVFIHGAGTQIMLQSTSRQHSLPAIESAARKYVNNEDEVNAIMRHVKRYMNEGDIEMLVHPLLAILDKPKKIIVLKEIRCVILPTDIGRFDSMVSRTEVEAYDELQVSTDPSVVQREQLLQKADNPPKKTLLATKPGMKGDFSLKTQEQFERERRQKDELERLKKERQLEVKKKKEMVTEDSVKPLEYSHIPVVGPPPVASTPNGTSQVERVASETGNEENSGIVLIRVTDQSEYADISPLSPEARIELSANQVTEAFANQDVEIAVNQIGQVGVSDDDGEIDSDVDSCDSNGSRSGIYHINAQEDGSDNDSEVVADELALTTGEDHDLVVTSVSSSMGNYSSPPISPASLANESSMSINLPSSSDSSANHSPTAVMSSPLAADDSADNVTDLYAKVDFTKKKPKSSSKVITKVVHDGDISPPPTPPRNAKGILKNKDEMSLSYEDPSPLTEIMENIDTRPKSPQSPDTMSQPAVIQSSEATSKPMSRTMEVEKTLSLKPAASESVYETVEPLVSTSEITVQLKKTKSSLGMSISGGRDSKTQPTVKIERVFAGGSAAENGTLKAGYEIVSVEGQSLKGASHPEAVDIIRRAYQNKKTTTMTMVVLPTS